METILMQQTVLFHQNTSRFRIDLPCSASRSGEETCCERNCWRNVWPSDPQLAVSSGAAEMLPPRAWMTGSNQGRARELGPLCPGMEECNVTILRLLSGNIKLSRNKQIDGKKLKAEEMPSITILRQGGGGWVQKTNENKMKLIKKKKVTRHVRFLSFSQRKPNDFLLSSHPPSIHFSNFLCLYTTQGR